MRRTEFAGHLGVLLEATGDDGRRRPRGFKGGEMGPLLKVTMVSARQKIPSVQRSHPMDIEQMQRIAGLDGQRKPKWVLPSDPEASASEPTGGGLSPACNFPKATVYGRKGLTDKGKRRIEEGGKLMEMDRRLLVFWTATVPDPAQDALEAGRGSTSALTGELMEELSLELKRLHLPPEILGCVEVQEERYLKTGRLVPHWHLIFHARRHRRGQRLMTFELLDNLWRRVVLRVTGVDICAGAPDGKHNACRREDIKQTVRGYMRKYMRKGASKPVLEALKTAAPQLIPGQWWCMSRPLLQAIKELTGRLDPSLLLYINEMEKELINDGLLFCRWSGKLDGVPPMVTYYFPSLDALAAIVARWQTGYTAPPGTLATVLDLLPA